MKFDVSIEVESPVNVVSEHFANRENQTKWFPDLKEVKVLEGTPGQEGCKSLLKFANFEIVETILKNSLPEEFLGDYDTPKICRNTMKTEFASKNGCTTCRVTVHYTEMNWFLRFMSLCMPWTLKGQVKKYLKKFKQVIESENQG